MSEISENSPVNRPSLPAKEWSLYEPRIEQETQRIIGIRTPSDDYYPFEEGESIEFVRDGKGDREAYIRLKEGSRVTFSSWERLRNARMQEIFSKMDPVFAKLFQYTLSEFPELMQVHLKSGTEEEYGVLSYTGGFFRKPNKDNPNPLIVLGSGGELKYKELLKKRRVSAEFAANSLGVDIGFL